MGTDHFYEVHFGPSLEKIEIKPKRFLPNFRQFLVFFCVGGARWTKMDFIEMISKKIFFSKVHVLWPILFQIFLLIISMKSILVHLAPPTQKNTKNCRKFGKNRFGLISIFSRLGLLK